jgi:hypothetical protein
MVGKLVKDVSIGKKIVRKHDDHRQRTAGGCGTRPTEARREIVNDYMNDQSNFPRKQAPLPALIDPGVVISFAVDRWLAEVKNRPLVNKNRRTLDDTWRQVIRRFGGDPDALIGPSHDELLARQCSIDGASEYVNCVDCGSVNNSRVSTCRTCGYRMKAPTQPTALNLKDKAEQKRLATLWGYVPAVEKPSAEAQSYRDADDMPSERAVLEREWKAMRLALATHPAASVHCLGYVDGYSTEIKDSPAGMKRPQPVYTKQPAAEVAKKGE